MSTSRDSSMNSLFARAGLQVFERGWLSSNNVLFHGGPTNESVLVDSGYCSHAAQTLELVKFGLGGLPLARVLNTHLHSDHCGGNAALQNEFGCAINVPSGEADKVDRWDESALTYRDTGQTCPRFVQTGVVRDGDEIRLGAWPWKVIAAPGHDPESVVLYQADFKLLISADALWQNGFGVVFPEIEGVDAFNIVGQTLDRLAQLDVDWVIPGHGSPFQGFQSALTRARQRLDAFVTDPGRHARHAAKVLIKFHLLEVKEAERDPLVQWMAETRFMRLTHARHFASIEFAEWADVLVSELAASSAIQLNGNLIRNN